MIITTLSFSVPEHQIKSEIGTSLNSTYMEEKTKRLEMQEKDTSIVNIHLT